MTSLLKRFALFSVIFLLTACPYRVNVLQGNFIEQDQVDELRVEMTQEQVIYVLGKPIIEDAFDPNTWHYLYDVRYGNGNTKRKELTLYFNDEKLTRMEGDFKQPETFNEPLSE